MAISKPAIRTIVFCALLLIINVIAIVLAQRNQELLNVTYAYAAMIVASMLLYGLIPSRDPTKDIGIRFDNLALVLVISLMIGAVWGIAMIFGKNIILKILFSAAVPASFSINTGGQILMNTILSPTAEAIFWRGAVPRLFDFMGLRRWVSAIIITIGFMIFHTTAYLLGGYASVIVPFISAGLFSIVMLTIVIKSRNVLAEFPAHIANNTIATFVNLAEKGVVR